MTLIQQDSQPPLPFYRFIKLTKGQYALVDEKDYKRVARHKWCAQWAPRKNGGGVYYAVRHVRLVPGGKQHRISMHRFIMNAPDGLDVDHIRPMDTLDNRRSNLRLATESQNAMNRRIQSNSETGCKGVSRTAKSGNYRARITINGEVICLGTRKTKKAASALYWEAALKYHGEFARLA